MRPPYEMDPYPELRRVLAPELAELPAEEIESAVEVLYGGEMSAEDLENFWRGFANAGRSIGQAVQQAAPTIGQVAQQALPIVGTVAGTAFGGPIGAALGGAAGQALSGAIGGTMAPGSRGGAGRRALAGLAHGMAGGTGGLAGALPGLVGRGAGAIAPALGGIAGGAAGGAAGQLVRLLSRPEVLQALTSMMLGPAGRRQVPVGGTPVPVASFANLLGVLANQAAAEHHLIVAGESAGTPSYLLDNTGEAIGDPFDPVSRAEVLLMRLAGAEAIEATEATEATKSWSGSLSEADLWPNALEVEEAFWIELALAEAEEV
jgi:hypothetical protein